MNILIKKITIIIEGDISKNVMNTYRKNSNILLIWRDFFLNIVINRDYVYNFCNRPMNNFDRYCREWYLDNNPDADDIRLLDDALNIAYCLML